MFNLLERFQRVNKNECTEKEYFSKINYEVMNDVSLENESTVAVVVPIYNAEKYLTQTIDSVILQNIGFQHISLILVDDRSSDTSREIMTRYSRLYPNIVSIFLEENTGTPAYPRNLGAHLANATYIMFLDADDWLSHQAIKTLYDLMEKTGVDYSVGKTVQVGNDGKKVIGQYESCINRESVSPFSIKHLFYHLGPRARMVRLDLIRRHHLRFPEMKFSEDKQFFIDVLCAAGTISTTTETIYYLNRKEENDSLTKQTNVMEKMDTNLAVLRYVLDKDLPMEQEKMIVNRLIEFDCITRLFDRNHFVKSKNKRAYYEKLYEALKIFKRYKRNYAIEDTIIKPINRFYFQLFQQKQYEKLEQLARWSKKNDERILKMDGDILYEKTPLENTPFAWLPVRFHAEVTRVEMTDEHVYMVLNPNRSVLKGLEMVQFTKRDAPDDVQRFGQCIQREDGPVVILDKQAIQSLAVGGYVIYAMYNEYEKTTMKKVSEDKIEWVCAGKRYTFYQTIKGNVSLKVTEE